MLGMSIRNRLIGPCANIRDDDRDNPVVDVSSLVHRMLLFDSYILESIRLTEFPKLVEAFGYEGVMTLLRTSAFRIHCDALGFAQIGQSDLELRRQKGLLPLGSYAFARMIPANRREYIHQCMQNLERIDGITHKEKLKLQSAIAESLIDPPENRGVASLDQFRKDLDRNTPEVARGVALALARKTGSDVSPADFSVTVHRIDETDFSVESDISTRFKLTVEDTHKIVEAGLLAVASLDGRLETMKTYSALAGLREQDLPVFDDKFDFLSAEISPDAKQARLRRILTVAGLPDVNAETRIDVKRLLEIRASDECKAFRAWLETTDEESDNAVREHFQGLRARVTDALGSRVTRGLRFLVTTGLGSINPLVGMAAGAADSMLVDELLPKPGPTAFLSNLYPSIFQRKTDPLSEAVVTDLPT